MINKAGLDLIKSFEGFEAKAYVDPVGVLTIGYGTTATAGVGIAPKLGMQITEAQATEYLMAALNKFSGQIAPLIKGDVNANEWAAMQSLAYNIGPTAFERSSVLRKFNAGDKRGAADAFLLWNKAGGKVLKGLVRRREAERALFLAPVTSHNSPDIGMPITEPSKPRSLFAAIIAIIVGLIGFKISKGD